MPDLVRGVDISALQKVTSWGKLAAAARFCFVKATEGEGYTSSAFRHYFASARAAGMCVGSYHYAGSSRSRRLGDPVREARHYATQLRNAGWRTRRDLPPVLDIEVDDRGKTALTDWCLEFVHEVDDVLGLVEPWLRCGFYCSPDYYNNRLNGPALHSGRWLWRASWPNPTGAWPAAEGDKPAGAAVWQWTDRARVPGISGGVDGDVARLEDLQQLAPDHFKPAPKPTPVEEIVTPQEIEQVAQRTVQLLLATQLEPGKVTRAVGGYPEGWTAAYAAFQYAPDAKLNEVRRTLAQHGNALEALGDAVARVLAGLGAVPDGQEIQAAVREALVGKVDVSLVLDNDGA